MAKSYKVLVLLAALAFVSVSDRTAEAGVLGVRLMHRIDVPMMLGSFDRSSGDLNLLGLATSGILEGPSSMFFVELNANFDSSGAFNLNQKGSFAIWNGEVELLKGTITEASGAVFGSELKFRANMDIQGEAAPLYNDEVAINVNVSPMLAARSRVAGFSFAPTVLAQGQAVVGRTVPEPSSWVAMATCGLLVLIPASRRRRRIA